MHDVSGLPLDPRQEMWNGTDKVHIIKEIKTILQNV